MLTRTKIGLIAAIAVLLIASCAAAGGEEGGGGGSTTGNTTSGAADTSGSSNESTSGGDGVNAPDGAPRLLIQDAEIGLETVDIPGAAAAVRALAGELGGFVDSSAITGKDELERGRVTIRVPVGRFEEALSRLRVMGEQVLTESSTSQDVTEEFVDLQARLVNQKSTEAQYLLFMERAETISEVLTVQRQLTSTQEEIERLKGRIQFLESSAAMSRIDVRLTPVPPEPEPEPPIVDSGWAPLDTVTDAARVLFDLGQGLIDMGIWIAIFSPIWAPAIAVAIFFIRRIDRPPRSRTSPTFPAVSARPVETPTEEPSAQETPAEEDSPPKES